MSSSSTLLPSVVAESEGEGQRPVLYPPMPMPMPLPLPFVPTGVFPSPMLLTTMRPLTPPAVEKHEPSRFPSEMPTVIPPTPPASHQFEHSQQGSPIREEGEVPDSELDPDTRRRLLILQHGQETPQYIDTSHGPSTVPLKPILHVTVPALAPAGGWLGAEEEMSPRQVSRTSSGMVLEPESPSFGKQRSHSSEFVGPDGISQVYIYDPMKLV